YPPPKTLLSLRLPRQPEATPISPFVSRGICPRAGEANYFELHIVLSPGGAHRGRGHLVYDRVCEPHRHAGPKNPTAPSKPRAKKDALKKPRRLAKPAAADRRHGVPAAPEGAEADPVSPAAPRAPNDAPPRPV